MADTIIRPPVAGTREAADYSASFNKEKLGNLKSMFEQKRNESSSTPEPKKFGKYNKINNKIETIFLAF